MTVPPQRTASFTLAAALILIAGCKAPPSAVPNGVALPIPPGLEQAGRLAAPATRPVLDKYVPPGQPYIELTPMRVIHLAFENSPQIKGAYLKYVSEKARYDYILANWTSTTPGLLVGPTWGHTLGADDITGNTRAQQAQVFVERNFVDTSRLRVFADAINEDTDDAHGYHPAVGGLLHFPLYGSREALQRASDQIFQQNRLNDAQLDYVKMVRQQLSDVTGTFFAVLSIGQRVQACQRRVDDLQAILQRMRQAGRSPADQQRVEAAVTTATTELRSVQSNYAVELAWMTSTMGLPHDLEARLVEEPFNPFGEIADDALLALSAQTDPEIATLKNAIKDSEVQLALARKGRLDIAANLGTRADLRGSGTWTGRTEYQADASLAVGFIDPRISSSLAREASSNIARYQYAIRKRQNEVYVEAVEPLIKIRMLAKNIPERLRNVEQYRRDFAAAVQDYFAERMNVDDLVRRREDLLTAEFELSYNKSDLGGRMAALARATGKFFDLLAQPLPATTQPSPASQSAPAAQSIAATRTQTTSHLMQEILP